MVLKRFNRALWAVELVASIFALPVALVMLVLGNSHGWIVVAVVAGLWMFWALQCFVLREDPDAFL
jgi:fatty acid desaturase